MYDAGADIIYQAAGGSGGGVFEAAKAANAMAIGVDSDQAKTADPGVRDVIITSMIKKVDVAVFDFIKSVNDGSVQAGPKVYDLKAGGVDYSTTGGKIDDITAKLDELKQKIIPRSRPRRRRVGARDKLLRDGREEGHARRPSNSGESPSDSPESSPTRHRAQRRHRPRARRRRRERGRQVDADEDPLRHAAPRRGRDQGQRREGRLPLPRRRDRGRHRHGAPALHARRQPDRAGERDPRQRAAADVRHRLRRGPPPDQARSPRVRPRRRPRRARRGHRGRRAAARGDPQGPLPRRAHPHPRRAHRGARAAGGGGALRATCARSSSRA